MESAITTTTSKYVRDFESLFVPIQVDQIRDRARNGNLRHCQFRSLCWRYFLKCLPEQYDQWLNSSARTREQYEEIRAKHASAKNLDDHQQSSPSPSSDKLISEKQSEDKEQNDKTDGGEAPSVVMATKNKDLEEEQQYIKAANQCDHKNVFRTIERDVVRTFPDMEFFRQTEMQSILENVLLYFASENPHLSYKQGMHELLATLLYVLHTDSQNCLINYEGGYANETIATLLDLKYLEHDVYHLFCALMKCIESWYQNDEILMLPHKKENGEIVNRSTDRQQVGSVLGFKLEMISENIVKNYDLELFNHLEALQIAPQIYGIRWMRLLFGREFDFLDLLTVWDTIICDQAPMSLTDYIFASMLVTIREELVNGDYTDCLNNLMRHQFKDVQYVIKLALHLRDPKNNPRPRSLQLGTQKRYNQSMSHNRYSSPETSLTSKLSQQYISGKQQIQQATTRNYNLFTSATNQAAANVANYAANADSTRRYSPKMNNSSNIDNRDSRKIFSMTTKPQSHDRQHQQRMEYKNANYIAGAASSGIRFLTPASRNSGTSLAGSTNKFLPNINKFVSSIGQNIQEKSQFSTSSSSKSQPQQHWSSSTKSSHGSSKGGQRVPHQQYHHRSGDNMLLADNPVREYEMREMQSASSSSTSAQRGVGGGQINNRFPIGSISGTAAGNALNLSTESYDDLHSIVDYCWRLLSEQIDSLQKCLPKEKGLHSEDEIFVALAQLKKVRDVLKGSLRLEDELESPPGGSKT